MHVHELNVHLQEQVRGQFLVVEIQPENPRAWPITLEQTRLLILSSSNFYAPIYITTLTKQRESKNKPWRPHSAFSSPHPIPTKNLFKSTPLHSPSTFPPPHSLLTKTHLMISSKTSTNPSPTSLYPLSRRQLPSHCHSC